jgi:hypothetical protein
MTVYLCRTYVVKPGKLKEHNEWGKRLIVLMKTKPELFDGAKSLQVLSHKRSREARKFTALWGFDSLTDVEYWEKAFCELPQENALRSEFMELVVPESFSVSLLEPIKIMRKIKSKHPKK